MTRKERNSRPPQWVTVRNQEGTLDSDIMVSSGIIKMFEGDTVMFCMGELIDGSMTLGVRIYGVYNF